jgi:hypothetical protein
LKCVESWGDVNRHYPSSSGMLDETQGRTKFAKSAWSFHAEGKLSIAS